MCRLYEFLNGQVALRRQAANLPLIRLEDGTHVQADTDGQPQAFLPWAVKTDFPTVRGSVCSSEDARAFLCALGLTEPEPVDDVIWNILPKYGEDAYDVAGDTYEPDIRRILDAFATDSKGQRDKLVAALRKIPFVMAVDAGDGSRRRARPGDLYLATKRLKNLFSGITGILLVDDDCAALCGEDMRDLLEACDTVRYLKPISDTSIEQDYKRLQDLRKKAGHAETSGRNDRVIDWMLHGLHDLLVSFSGLAVEKRRTKARLLWEELTHLKDRPGETIFAGDYTWTHNGKYNTEFDSAFVRRLKESEWVPDHEGNLQRPELIPFESIGWTLNPFLLSKIHFKPPVIDQLAEEAGFEPEVLDLLKKHGITSAADLIARLRLTETASPEDSAAGPTAAIKNVGARQFISCVAAYPGDEESDPDDLGQLDRMDVEAKAIDFILNSEPNWKRTSASNPGFDLFEAGPDGEPMRWCEVKAMTGSLNDRPVGLSRRQFEWAHGHGANYWLYVVECAGDESARIVRIQDPIGKARTFTFDRGWLGVAEVDSEQEHRLD